MKTNHAWPHAIEVARLEIDQHIQSLKRLVEIYPPARVGNKETSAFKVSARFLVSDLESLFQEFETKIKGK